jgi:hypothetical protein
VSPKKPTSGDVGRRSFGALLWGAVFALFLRAPRTDLIREDDEVPWDLAKQYKLGPSTDLELPWRMEYRDNPDGGWLVRSFYSARSPETRGSQSVIVVMHLDSEVSVSECVSGEGPSVFSRLKRWLSPTGRGRGEIRRGPHYPRSGRSA